MVHVRCEAVEAVDRASMAVTMAAEMAGAAEAVEARYRLRHQVRAVWS